MATSSSSNPNKGAPLVTRVRLSTSTEPTGMAGTSWNSMRWSARPSGSYRTSRLANAFETSSNCSSAGSSCSSSLRGPSPLSYTLASLRSSARAASAATRPQNDAGHAIRPNSRYGTALNSSGASNDAMPSSRTSQSAKAATTTNILSPRQEPLQRNSYPYRSIGLSQPRAALVDMRQNLRPVKRQIVTDYKSAGPSTRSPFVSSTTSSTASPATSIPLTLFTNSQLRSSAQSAISPTSKCMSPPMSMSRSSSTVTSPLGTPITVSTRPIPKSERPWRQKLADAQRLREAQAERGFASHMPMEPYDSTARIMAARSARRASVEQQQTQKQQNSEQQLEKEIAALKCYVSEPGALDKNATVAKFRQRMAESQALPSSITSPPSSSSALINSSSSTLLARMPSMSRRSTTEVTKEMLPSAAEMQKTTKSSKERRPLSMVETPFGQRRLSIVQETSVSELRPGEELPSSPKSPTEKEKTSLVKGKAKESPKGQRKKLGKDSAGRQASAGETTAGKPAGEKKGTPLFRRKKKEEQVEEQPANNKGQTVEKSREDERQFNAVVQFKPQSMLRRKISTEEETKEEEKKKEAAAIPRSTERQATTPRWRKKGAIAAPLVEHEQSPKPVPGTWESTPKERFISQNRHLTRKAASESAGHVHRVCPLARVCSVRILTAGRLAKMAEASPKSDGLKAKSSPTASMLKMIKSIARPKQRICAVASLDKQFANKRSFRLGVRRTLLLKSVSQQRLYAQLNCKSSTLLVASVRFNIVWKDQRKTANVTILLADLEHVTSALIREPSKSGGRKGGREKSPLKRIQRELDKENMAQLVLAEKGGKEQQRIQQQQTARKQQRGFQQIPSSNRHQQLPAGAALVAAAAGNIAVVALGSSSAEVASKQQQKGTRGHGDAQKQQQQQQFIAQSGSEIPLILPDQSVLEQFVQQKRDALNRLHEEAAEQTLDQQSRAEAVSLPGSKRNSRMLATAMHAPAEAVQLPQSLSNSFHAAVQATAADLRAQQQQQQQTQQPLARLRRPPELGRATLSTQQFEKPKSLFEEQMQRQAIQMQQKAVRQSLHEPSAIERATQGTGGGGELARRRSAAGEHAGLAQTFVAQAQKPHQQEQRYAAHIPLSGRQSTASIESANSSALDAATRQLDQMIDQARYKHSQQRNKFKEAIDYLDHIFEDFQREADLRPPLTTAEAAKPGQKEASSRQKATVISTPAHALQQQQLQAPIEPVQATFRPGNVKSAKEAFEKVAAAIAGEKKQSQPTTKLKKQTSAPSSSEQAQRQRQQPSVPQRPEPFPIVVHPPSSSAPVEAEEEDIEVAETIVLPSKNTADRLDFTKSWLTSGHVRTWAEGSPRKGDGLLGQKGTAEPDDCYDSDEHSLGSCSAEVAAINICAAKKGQRKQQPQQKADQWQHQQGGGMAPALKGKTTAKQPSGGVITIGGTMMRNGAQPLRQKQPPPTASVPPPQIAAVPTIAGTAGTVRPQPYRPQPQLGLLPPALGASGQMHKVPSIEHLRLRASQERACSQDYQSMGSSVHSQEGFRPAATCISTHSLQRLGVSGGGAFHSYTPTMPLVQQPQHHLGQQMKGSIQSLPDSALCTGPLAGAGLANYPPAFPYQPSRQFATLARMDHPQHQQTQPRATIVQPPPVPAHQPPPSNASLANEHALAIDALVAELELNTDAQPLSNGDAGYINSGKRRSFPTMQTELALAKASQAEQQNHHHQTHQMRHNQTDTARSAAGRQHNGVAKHNSLKAAVREAVRPLERLSEMLINEQPNNGQREVERKQSGGGGNRPFETINQEKLNPSKVDAMARIFGQQGRAADTSAVPMSFTNIGGGNTTNLHTWTKRANTTGRIPSNQRIAEQPERREKNLNAGDQPPSAAVQFTTTARQTSTTSQQQQNGEYARQHNSNNNHLSRQHTSQQQSAGYHSPKIVRGTRAGAKAAHIEQRRTATGAGKQVETCRLDDTPIGESELLTMGRGCTGNGLYDNVQRPRPSPGYATGDDCSSLSSSQGAVLPPTAPKSAGGRIGQLIRKLGTGKPPVSAASMVSLNRVTNEQLSNGSGGEAAVNGGGLTKANSLSGDPWRCQVLVQNGAKDSEEDKHNGIGNRLKQTIFGGMVRRRVPT